MWSKVHLGHLENRKIYLGPPTQNLITFLLWLQFQFEGILSPPPPFSFKIYSLDIPPLSVVNQMSITS